MQRVWLVLLLMVGAPAAGCKGCAEKEHVVEVTYTSWHYDVDTMFLHSYERSGYKCASQGAIRNAFGGEIGAKYLCTKCE